MRRKGYILTEVIIVSLCIIFILGYFFVIMKDSVSVFSLNADSNIVISDSIHVHEILASRLKSIGSEGITAQIIRNSNGMISGVKFERNGRKNKNLILKREDNIFFMKEGHRKEILSENIEFLDFIIERDEEQNVKSLFVDIVYKKRKIRKRVKNTYTVNENNCENQGI